MHTLDTPSKPRGWNDLTLQEFKSIYPVIEENANRHFRCAEILGKSDEPQNAIAHLILGTEELIKAFACLLMSRKVPLRQQSWFKKIFLHHKVRHDLVKDFFSMYLLFRFSSSTNLRPTGIFSFLGAALMNTAMATANYFWWSNADSLKQRAFYVDFINSIVDPSTITAGDYQVAKAYVNLFQKDIAKLMRSIEVMSDKELKSWTPFNINELDKLREQAYKLQKERKKS
ncbi:MULTISPECIES: AbiV family abortive infection protein [Pedobacter]|uniref:AbiV family abortive infection protein n=1 Tax=Pedobacter TaxID=84567 RepID=UPI00103C1CAE|nr:MULTISPECIES: AbiV family abortive infection protein [Pedobacter]MCX2575692.1 AbiV family abortive infection protein [Pedobacter sandarakinus]